MVARASVANAGPGADRHPMWPHKQVTTPQSARAWRALLNEHIPLATGSMLRSYTTRSSGAPGSSSAVATVITSAVTPVKPRTLAGSGHSPSSSMSGAPDTPPRRGGASSSSSAAMKSSSAAAGTVGRASVSATVVTLRCLSNVLAPLLLDAFHSPLVAGVGGAGVMAGSDAGLASECESRASALLSSLLPLLMPVLQHHHPLHLPFMAPSVSMLASLSSPGLGFVFKSWRHEAWLHFMASNDGVLPPLPASPAQGVSTAAATVSALSASVSSAGGFFRTDVVCLSQWRWVLSRIVDEDASLLGAFIQLPDNKAGLNINNLAQVASSVMGGAMLTGGLSSGGGALGLGSGGSTGAGGVLTPFSGLFGSSESLLASRRSALKKLAFLIHAGRTDQYARHLSAILEKVTENLKIVAPTPSGSGAGAGARGAPAPTAAEATLIRSVNALHAQVFLCLRVLVARVSSEHLQSIWPIVLMELIRLFQGSALAPRASADTVLLASALKFIDVARVMMPAQFALYVWMFLQENVDNLFASTTGGADGGFVPHVQHLEVHDTAGNASSARSAAAASAFSPSGLLRPVLLQRHVSSLAELATWHARLSGAMSAAAQGRTAPQPDVAFVDALLLSDMSDYEELTPAQPAQQPPSASAASTKAQALAAPQNLNVRAATPTPSPQPPRAHPAGLSVNPLASPLPGAATPASSSQRQQPLSQPHQQPPVHPVASMASPPLSAKQPASQLPSAVVDSVGLAPTATEQRPTLPFPVLSSLVQGPSVVRKASSARA